MTEYVTKIHSDGDKITVESGGEINMKTGAKLTPNSGTQPTIADLTENSGAIGGTNDGDLPDLSTPDAAGNAAAVREVATKVNEIAAALRAAGIAV